MRRIIFEEFGSPADMLKLVDAPAPEPGPQDVRVRLTARPINPADLLSVTGEYGRRPRLPATPGLEGAGQIESVGAEVTAFQPGQRVIVLGPVGTWQETIVTPAISVVPTPDSMPDAVACQAMINPLTAWLLLFDVFRAKPEDWIVQTGAGSAVGRLIIQLAKLNGVSLINIVRRPESVDMLKAVGAETILLEDEDLAERIPAIVGKMPVTKALDAVGGSVAGRLSALLGYGGELVSYGALSGEPIAVDPGRLIFKRLSVRGFWLSDWLRESLQERREQVLSDVLKLLATEKLTLGVEASYDLADFRAAIDHAGQAGRTGKIILTG